MPAEEMVEIAKLTVDGSNPNRMDDAKYQALKRGIRRWGFIVPIITNSAYLVADGEHRLKAAKELGMDRVRVIKLPVREVDRRLLRQVLNKLRGEHDELMDREEFAFIEASMGTDDLAGFMGMENEELLKMLDASQGIDEKIIHDIEVTHECPKCNYKW